MSLIDWTMEGYEVVSCNCTCGCPCQFNQRPTHGNCRAYTFIRIERGRYGDVPLDGLAFGFLAEWPGAIHEGRGTFQAVVDSRASADQRAALEAVAHGRDTDPGTLVLQVFSTTVTNVLPTITAPIEMACDLEARTARLHVPGIVDGTVSPIRNPITGAAHAVRVTLPRGFEYTEAEYAMGTTKAEGAIALDFSETHAHLARIHWSTHGVVR